MSYLFSGLIECLNCGKRYRGKRMRNVPSYICSGNHNYGNDFCERFVIREDEIVDLINAHFKGEKWEVSEIKSIAIKDKSITIEYLDNSKSKLSQNHYLASDQF